jgi:ketosteroid isomerase-like protein
MATSSCEQEGDITMTTLPGPISDYYSAESRNDSDALARLFSADCIVRDEGQTFNGRAAVASWMKHAKAKYSHRTEVLSARQDGDAWIVSVRVSGSFPNSPVTLVQRFRLSGNSIAALEIG